MTKAIRYIIFTLVIWAYIFGSSGFVVHKCYMSDSCFVSNSIINAWNSFTSGNCTNTQAGQASSDERENTDNVCVWAQTKGKCSESVYALNDYQFQNQSDTDIQPLVSQADLGYQNDFPSQITEKIHRLNSTSQSLHGIRHSLDRLCIFLI